jgi:hypothetical protein
MAGSGTRQRPRHVCFATNNDRKSGHIGMRTFLHSASNILMYLERAWTLFTAKSLMRMKSVELPKLHRRVRFPSPTAKLSGIPPEVFTVTFYRS